MTLILSTLLILFFVPTQKQIVTCVVTDTTHPPVIVFVCDGYENEPQTADFSKYPEWHFKEVVHHLDRIDSWVQVVKDPIPEVGQIIKRTFDGDAVAPCQERLNRALLEHQVKAPGSIAPNQSFPDCGELSPFLRGVLRKVKR